MSTRFRTKVRTTTDKETRYHLLTLYIVDTTDNNQHYYIAAVLRYDEMRGLHIKWDALIANATDDEVLAYIHNND